MTNLYEKLPDDILVQFYEEISKNIETGILTDAMCIEIELIDEVFTERGLDMPNIPNVCNTKTL